MSIKALITEENWPYSRLKNDNYQAFISFGAIPDPQQDQVKYIYSVTVTDSDFQELLQKNFSDMSGALECINKTYGHWQYQLASEKPSGDGCSSCVAH